MAGFPDKHSKPNPALDGPKEEPKQEPKPKTAKEVEQSGEGKKT